MPNINPVAFQIFGLSINWYGVIIAAAVALAIFLCMREAKRIGLDPDQIIDLALLCIPIAIICARLYYVVFEWDMFYTGSFMTFLKNVVNTRSGGLAIYGAIIGGFIAVSIFSRWKKIPFWKLIDIIIPSLILAQGLGRWGNFFNQEAYGLAIYDSAWQFFPAAVYIPATGNWHMATFFYESIWCILAFFALYFFQKKSKKSGDVFALYLVLYGFERMIVEGLRLDSLWWGSIRVSQALSAVMFIAGCAYLIWRYVNHKKSAETAAEVHVSEDLLVVDGEFDRAADDLPSASPVLELHKDEQSAQVIDDDDSGEPSGENLWATEGEAYVYDEEAIRKQLEDNDADSAEE